jgi:hypothetical protein
MEGAAICPFELHEDRGMIATGTFGRTVNIERPLEILLLLRSSNDTLAQIICTRTLTRNSVPVSFISGLKLGSAPAATRSASNYVLMRRQSRAGRLKALSSTPCQSMGTGL